MIHTNIYTLRDPITNEIRYVGKTNNISERYKAHLNKARKHQIHKKNWINSLKNKGLKPIIEIIDIVPITEWIFWEKYWISQMKTWGFNLINYTEGGDGCTFGNQTSFKKGNITWNKGTRHKKICSICNKKYSSSPSSKSKFCSKKCYIIYQKNNLNNGCFQKGSKPWNKGKKGIKLKPDKNIYQYSAITGKFIKKWDTAKKAGENLNINFESIGHCCRNKSKTAGGFVWKYNYFNQIEPVNYIGKTNNKIKNNLK